MSIWAYLGSSNQIKIKRDLGKKVWNSYKIKQREQNQS